MVMKYSSRSHHLHHHTTTTTTAVSRVSRTALHASPSSSFNLSGKTQETIATAAVMLSVVGSTLLMPYALPTNPVTWAAADDESSSVSAVSGKLIRTAPASEGLTASSLIKSDIEFYFKELQDMSYVLKQCDQIIDNRDYESIRGILRQEPLRTLRKTSKALQKVQFFSSSFLYSNLSLFFALSPNICIYLSLFVMPYTSFSYICKHISYNLCLSTNHI